MKKSFVCFEDSFDLYFFYGFFTVSALITQTITDFLVGQTLPPTIRAISFSRVDNVSNFE